jgi:nitrogen fixation NifU-like protein
MMSAAIKGKPVAEAEQLIRAFKALMSIHESRLEGDAAAEEPAEEAPTEEKADVRLGDLEALQGVVRFPVRIKCATLAWNTLRQALDQLAGAQS